MSNTVKSVIVGTAGHIDHGKSALVEALTGTHPDRLKEEKRRGITIDLGFAFLEENGVRFGFVDVPGHERFVSNMLAGAGGIDVLLLVIAADESIKPQTREHFDICRLLGVQRGVVALTKSDLAGSDTLELVKLEAQEYLHGSFLENAPLVPRQPHSLKPHCPDCGHVFDLQQHHHCRRAAPSGTGHPARPGSSTAPSISADAE